MTKAKKPNVFEPHDTVRMQALRGIPLASFRSRAFAFMLDLVIVVSAAVLVIAAARPGGFRGSEPVHFELFKSKWGIGMVVLYFGVLPRIWRGRTPGKRIFRLRVISLSHERLTLWQCVERALGYGFSSLEGGFGFIQYFLHPNRQTLHDRIAETIVISERKKESGSAGPNSHRGGDVIRVRAARNRLFRPDPDPLGRGGKTASLRWPWASQPRACFKNGIPIPCFLINDNLAA